MTSTSSGLTMLTSGVSQYLHPDYLQPLPTTLDAKKSPLALLAQTCSAIGKDTSPSKPIIPPLEKSDKPPSGASDSESTVPKRPSSHGSKDLNSKDSKPGFRTFPPKEIPPLVPISNQRSSPDTKLSATGSSSSSSSSSSIPLDASTSKSPGIKQEPGTVSVPANPTSSLQSSSSSSSSSSSRPVSRVGGTSSTNPQRSSSRNSNSGKEGDNHHHHHPHSSQQQQHHTPSSSHHQQAHHNHHRSRESPSSSLSSSATSSSSSSSPASYSKPSSSSHPTPVMQSLSSLSTPMKPSINTNPALLAGLSPAHLAAGYPHPLSLMGHGLDPSTSGYHSALAAHSSLSSLSAAAAAAQSSALKAAAAASAATGTTPPAALSPYVTYARVRTPSGASTLVPVCRDPYCTNCQLTLQNSHLSATCTAPGCAQCAHEKSLTSLSALGPLGAASSLLFPPLSTSSASPLSNNLSAQSSLHSLYPPSALAAAAAHQGLPYTCNWVSGNDYCGKRFNSSEELLQHLRTHTSSIDSSSLAASYAGLGLPSALAAAYPHFPAGSAPLSPNSLRRAYPTSLSPVSNLLGASNRYHPYKSPLSGVPPAPQTPQNFPPVGPFFSPYTFFGQRLGAAVVP